MFFRSKCTDAICGGKSFFQLASLPAGGLKRRDFLRLAGVGATSVLAFRPWLFAMAGPFSRSDFDKLVPEDKKLLPAWVKSLTARGERTVYRGADLKTIGMPIGGICAGQLYLGGDGKLWHWDIFNRKISTGADHYAKPLKPTSPLDQGFALRVTSDGKQQERAMDAAHWKDVSFTGEYPIGYVNYTDPECPVAVNLEAFSPFTPLSVDDSSLPATVLEFTLKNTGATTVEGEFAGWLENAVCLYSGPRRDGLRRNRITREPGLLFMECSAEDLPVAILSERPDIVFEDFESETYGNWAASGTAFGSGPVEAAHMPAYQGDVGANGKRLVNSHASAPGSNVGERDNATGRLTGRPFAIERNYITFLIGGGNHKGRTCMNLLVDDTVVLSAVGAASNKLQPMSWDVRQWLGKIGRIIIVDEQGGNWGNISVDDIIFSDRPREDVGPLGDEEDFGTMGLALLDAQPDDIANPSLPPDDFPAGIFSPPANDGEPTKKQFGRKLMGSLARKFKLAPGATAKVTFVLTWFFPNLRMNRLPPGRYYGSKFNSAGAVVMFIAKNFSRLAGQTRQWHDTWYDSTLPYWFLDRTFLNISALASSSCHRFGNGRFYSWEGVGCCQGTCGHVWHYAHGMARVFPELERQLREKVDFGLALQPDGAIHFRGEFNNIPAIDAQAGTVLRALREHQMSADASFLKANWPRIMRATEWLIAKDGNGDGLIESNQHNTLDTDWYGPVAWLSGLYLAALLAAEAMANEMSCHEFAAKCRGIFTVGQKNLVAQLFNSEYFMNKVDPKHLDAINSGTGCEIDQVMGQSWVFQVGLPRVLPEKETRSALQSLWKYNFTPDVGPYRESYKAGRWYAMPGEAGLLVCSFPRTDWDYSNAKGKGPDWAAGYFNECMNGFEYQAAGHMIWEGMVTEGLAVTRAVHDRYHPSRRNPWNEVECGDHYVRSMASHGVFIAACGFEYHGPNGRIGFAPRLTPENFKAPFIAAEGWGTYAQQQTAGKQIHKIEVKHGQLRLKTLALVVDEGVSLKNVKVQLGEKYANARLWKSSSKVEVALDNMVTLKADVGLTVEFDLHS